MSRSVRLRPWQHAALARYTAAPHPDFLAVATPGAGKTTFALTALRTALARKPARVVVVAPTAHLKVKWAAGIRRVTEATEGQLQARLQVARRWQWRLGR